MLIKIYAYSKSVLARPCTTDIILNVVYINLPIACVPKNINGHCLVMDMIANKEIKTATLRLE